MIENEDMNVRELGPEELEQIAAGRSAHQKLKATGTVHVRSRPDPQAPSLGTLNKGSGVTFLGEVKQDGRGAMWGKVKFKSKVGWISLNHSKII